MEEARVNPAGEEAWAEAGVLAPAVIVSALNVDTKHPMNEVVPALKPNAPNVAAT